MSAPVRIVAALLLALSAFAVGAIASRFEPLRTWLERPHTPAAPSPLPLDTPGSTAPRTLDTPALPTGATQFPTATLEQFSIYSCFRRDAALTRNPPSWLQRPPLGRFNAAETPARPYPDLAAYPGLVKLEQIRSPQGNAREHCAATRIAENWFLTAAHCIKPNAVDTLIIAPREDVNQEGTVILPVSNALCHRAWYSRSGKFDDDVALMYVDDVSAMKNVDILLPETPADGFLKDDYSGNIRFAGWGKNGDNRFLQGGPVTVSEVGTIFIRAEPVDGFGPCVGDSGGPLVVTTPDGRERVSGVLSSVTNDSCPPFGSAFYIRVSTMSDWINRTIAICNGDGRFRC